MSPPRPAALDLPQSFVLLACTVGLLALAGALLHQRYGVGGLVLVELLIVAAPTVAAVRGSGLGPTALGLRRPPAGAWIGAVCAGAGAFYLVSALVEGAIERLAPMPPAVREALRHVIVPAAGPRSLALDLLALALLPAACEELVFRGALLEAWKPAGRFVAAAGSALAFGGFHLSMYKLAPTAALGAVAAVIALRAGSVLPAMVFHATNNLLVVLLVRAGHDDPPAPDTRTGALLCAAAVILLALGLRWAGSPPPSVRVRANT